MKILTTGVFVLAAIALAGLLWIGREIPVKAVVPPPDTLAVFDNPAFGLPDGWQWDEFVTPAGKIRWGRTDPEAPKGTVFFLTGLSAPLEVYFESFSRFRDEGYSVIAMDWPGQGGSSRGSQHPTKIHAVSLDGHVEAAAMLSAAVIEPGASNFLVGLSMGAQLGARVAAESPDRFDAAALITPAFAIYGGRPTATDRFVLTALRRMGLGQRFAPGSRDWQFEMDVYNLEASDCSHPNPRTQIWQASMVRDPSIKVGGMTSAFILALADSADIAHSDAVLSQLTMPIWMPVASADVFVDNAVAEEACSMLADCQPQTYEGAKHCLFEESDAFYQPFMNDLVGFLNAQLAVTAQ
ncbi:MAG: alpha/beta fold hydrolase [Woeseiaceae bacterium]